MGWKNWPYWLRGGIILESFVIIVFLIYNFIWVPLFTDNLAILFLFIPGMILSWPISKKCFLAGFMGSPNNCTISSETYMIILIISSLIAYLIIGAIIGYIYGKIKSKK